MKISDTDVGAFCSITDASPEAAKQFIEMSGGDVDTAIGLYFEHGNSALANQRPAIPAPQPAAGTATDHEADEIESDHSDGGIEIVGSSFGQSSSRARGSASYAESNAINNSTSRGALNEDGVLESSHASGREEFSKLDEIFAPPNDLIFRGDFSRAKQIAAEENKWLLVHVLDPSEFKSLVLNRDVWKNPTVVEFVKDNFIFLQYRADTSDGNSYKMFYPMRGRWSVDVIDPLTGEKVKSLMGTQDPASFLQMAVDFIETHTLASNLDEPARVTELSEDEQLQVALNASLSATSSSTTEVTRQANPVGQVQDVEWMLFESIPSNESCLDNLQQPTTRVRIKLPSGETLTKTVSKLSTVKDLFQVAKANLPESTAKRFEMFSGNPPERLFSKLDQSVEEAKLSMAMILVEWA